MDAKREFIMKQVKQSETRPCTWYNSSTGTVKRLEKVGGTSGGWGWQGVEFSFF